MKDRDFTGIDLHSHLSVFAKPNRDHKIGKSKYTDTRAEGQHQ